MGRVPAWDKNKAYELMNNQSKFAENWVSGETLGTHGISDIICWLMLCGEAMTLPETTLSEGSTSGSV